MINKYNKKNIILIISSFISGALFTLLLLRYTPIIKIATNNNNSNKTIYEKSSLAKAVEKIDDAVVVVQSYKNDAINGNGTGFVYKVDNKYGYIITNEHVISKTDDMRVRFKNDKEAKVEVLGKDELIDLAVLRVEKKYVSLVATIGSSKEMNIGDTIFTVGTPLGYEYRGSVTAGVLSGKDRTISTTLSSSNNECIMNVLQIDASINPGNSGGPLLNANGEVIGICTLKLIDDEIEGMGFAIPIEDAMSYTDKLEKGEKIKRPKLGLTTVNATDTGYLAKLDITVPSKIYEGVVITGFANKDLSSKLKKGDIITEINGIKIKNIAYLVYEVNKYQPGEKVEITYNRKGKEKKVKIELDSE